LPDFSTGFTDIAGALRTFLGLTRHNRLREQLRDTLGLFSLAKEHAELGQVRDNLTEIATLQSQRLLALVKDDRKRQWNWGTFWVGFVFTGLGVWGEFWLWSFHQNWWFWFPFVVLGFFDLVFVIVSLQALFQRRSTTA
jgi:hypothetical protein